MYLRGLVRIGVFDFHKVGIDAIAYPKNNLKVGTNESVCPYFLLCGRYYYGFYLLFLSLHSLEKSECFVLVFFHNLTFSRSFIIDTTEVKDTMNDNSVKLVFV